MSEFNWLNELFSQTPEPVKTRKTIFEIAGLAHRENVNSNTLAFYLNENEEHGFGRLFFNSLLHLLSSKAIISPESLSIYETNYRVDREVYADDKRMDIVIRSDETVANGALWAIIIENKLHAAIYNDLSTYWNTVAAKNKVGLVISLFDNSKELLQIEKRTGIKFFNLLHSELSNTVLGQLHQHYLHADDRHLLILKDYFQTITNMSRIMDQKLLEKQWHSYQKYIDEIEKLKSLEKNLQEYTIQCFFSAMDQFGFLPNTPYTNTKYKHFISNDDFFIQQGLANPRYFRFYYWWEDLIGYSAVTVNFELFGDYTKFGPNIRKKLTEEYTPPRGFTIGINGGVDYEYYHLIVKDHLEFDKSLPLEQQIISILKDVFFNADFNVVQACTKWVEAEIESSKL